MDYPATTSTGLSGPPRQGGLSGYYKHRIIRPSKPELKLGRIIRPPARIIRPPGLSDIKGRIIRPPGLRACFAQPDPRSVCTLVFRSEVTLDCYINPQGAPIEGLDHV